MGTVCFAMNAPSTLWIIETDIYFIIPNKIEYIHFYRNPCQTHAYYRPTGNVVIP